MSEVCYITWKKQFLAKLKNEQAVIEEAKKLNKDKKYKTKLKVGKKYKKLFDEHVNN